MTVEVESQEPYYIVRFLIQRQGLEGGGGLGEEENSTAKQIESVG